MSTSACILSLISPVFHRMICGHFKEGSTKQLDLEGVESQLFQKVLKMACGVPEISVAGINEALQLAALADRFGMPDVRDAAEREAARHITVAECADILRTAAETGLPLVEAACHTFALTQFVAVAATDGFLALEEDEVLRMLEDDGLVAGGEEEVFEAVLRWMRGGPDGRLRGIALLDKAPHRHTLTQLRRAHPGAFSA